MVNYIQKEEQEVKNTRIINFNSNTLLVSTILTCNTAMFSTN
jgi:hypothetical protein